MLSLLVLSPTSSQLIADSSLPFPSRFPSASDRARAPPQPQHVLRVRPATAGGRPDQRRAPRAAGLTIFEFQKHSFEPKKFG